MHLKRLWLSHGPSLPQINLLRLQLHTSNPNKIITNPFVSHHHRCRPGITASSPSLSPESNGAT
ncbi:hypothetical protein HanIR_Chr12g0580271 [Helianthus annuus]|nr:hypothetical protein HanIR_Chr12g0580271 [Helianthus annuus]